MALLSKAHFRTHAFGGVELTSATRVLMSSKPVWHGEIIPSAVKRIVFTSGLKAVFLREIASVVGCSHDAVRLILKADGSFPAGPISNKTAAGFQSSQMQAQAGE